MAIQNYSLPILFCFLLTRLTLGQAQDKIPVKFGKVTPQDFAVTAPASDSSAAAIVVADFGSSNFQGDPKGWFTLEFTHSKRIRILKRTGFEAATVSIPLYVSSTSSQLEKITGLRAVTYNLEDGKVVETKLDSKSIFTDKLSSNWVEEKFTFPALKEGTIVEYTYTQTSPFLFNLQPWEFQGEYPCLWSEYQVELPNFFEYVTLAQGYLPFQVHTTASRQVTFSMTDPGGAGRDDHFTYDDQVVTHRWVMKNVPALKEEPYTTTIANYISKLEFQLSRYNFNYPGAVPKEIMGTWYGVSEGLLKDNYFGADLDSHNGWLDDDMKTITKGAGSNLEKAQKIYAYIRDNFTCTSHNRLYLSNPLKTVYKNRNGSEADLNLLLTAMLQHEKIAADPVILSTRSNGFIHTLYPLLSRFNYVICRVAVDSTDYNLDASEPWLGFGKLPGRCYNGYARVMNKERPSAALLLADSLMEGKTTLAIVSNDGNGGMAARLQSFPGPQEASELRQDVKEHGQQGFLKKIQTAYSGDATISNLELDSIRQPDQPLAVAYDVRLTYDTASDLYYFNPMLGEGYKDNPFKAAERVYPVEMPYAMDETFTMTMDIPTGYVVDELPKSAKVLFNTDEGFFEYLIQKSEDQIQFRSRIKLKKANFKPEDYETLRDFFAYVVKKQGEQIVFKKKK
jgi:hypothetical protein